MQKKFHKQHGRHGGAGRPSHGNGNQVSAQHAGIYRNPMGQPRHFMAGLPEDIEPISAPEPGPNGEVLAVPVILAAVDDLFFSVKITETARKVGAQVKFVKSDKELLAAAADAEAKPSLIILDLNSVAMKPLSTVAKIKADKDLKK